MTKPDGESMLQLLCPYGNWAHKNGMQVVDKTAAEKIRNAFMQSFDRIWGVPIYIGHPDDGNTPAKAKSVGRVESVSVTEDGIAISARYRGDAYEKISSGRLKWLSPRWRMEKLDDGTFRPVRLISVGMTDNPNIPGSGSPLKSAAAAEAEESGGVRRASMECRRLGESIARTREAAGLIAAESSRLRRERIDRGIRDMAAKPAPHELARMALERADRTGESYLESFTALRRKHYGKTKFGAPKSPANQRKK